MEHLDSRSDFQTDEEFANFRALIVNNKSSTNFFRSASSTSNRYGRAETVKKVMQKNGIKTVIDLSDLQCECRSEQFGYSIALLLNEAMKKPGPYIVQCESGKKRTGFLCIILEALSGTSYENIFKDYFESYKNNNGLDPVCSPEAVKRIIQQKTDSRIEYIMQYDNSTGLVNIRQAAISYLLHFGMTSAEIANLQNALY